MVPYLIVRCTRFSTGQGLSEPNILPPNATPGIFADQITEPVPSQYTGILCVPKTYATSTAGQASSECTTIALASDNPGYNVNAVPAAPLKDVIESVGPGCSS
jgi:hypothetical protein